MFYAVLRRGKALRIGDRLQCFMQKRSSFQSPANAAAVELMRVNLGHRDDIFNFDLGNCINATKNCQLQRE